MKNIYTEIFIVYINGIIKVCPEEYIKMFADDTLIHITGESNAELEIKMSMVFIIVKENIIGKYREICI